MNGHPSQTSHKSRLMFYDLCVARTRWYGAALAAALAYSVGGLVEHPTALAVIIVGIVLTGVTLGMQLFMYENEALKIRRIASHIDLDHPLDSQVSPAPWGATFCRNLTWNLIGIVAMVVVGDRLLHTFLPSSIFKVQVLEILGLAVVGIMIVTSLVLSLVATWLETKALNQPDATGKNWWSRRGEIIMATTVVLIILYSTIAGVVWFLRSE